MSNTHTTLDPGKLLKGAHLLRNHAPTWALGIEESGSARALAQGAVTLATTLAEQSPEIMPVATGLAWWAFARRPLDPVLAANGATLNGLPAPCRALAQTLAPLLAPPAQAQAMEELLDAGEAALVARHLLPRLHGENALAWLALAWDRLLRLGNADLPQTMLEAAKLDGPLAPLAARLKAEWAMLYLDPEAALNHVRALDKNIFGPWRSYMSAELLLRSGDLENGTAQLIDTWKSLAWHPQITLKLHSLLHPAPPTNSDFSDTAILIYSWNKADLLEATLKSVAKTDIRNSSIFVLDNGSTDHMQEAIARSKALFAPGRFHATTLPVNVGAPGARNWLLSLPQVRAMRRAAFLDDDVKLPVHWLSHLVSCAEANGEPDVVGCRITSATSPHTVQSADYHLLPPNDSVKTFVDYPEKIMVFDNCANDFDHGLYTYSRPATSVSGCCHLLSLAGVEHSGDFDIRFTPTQFDDLERDLRLGRDGLSIHYAGELAIRHIQHSSLAKAQSVQSIGHVFGNKIKLEGKYTEQEIRTLSETMSARLNADLATKEDDLLAQMNG